MAILAQNSPILKAQLPSTPKGFQATEGRLQPISHFASFCPQIPKFCLGSNRTIVGLKRVRGAKERFRRHGSNRTIVGLKLSQSRFDPPCVQQQSHHCGIETSAWVNSRGDIAGQQSHHCGIETLEWIAVATTLGEQQSHHCGIETDQPTAPNQMSSLQQSHHCGIETSAWVNSRGDIAGAAIAPLWD